MLRWLRDGSLRFAPEALLVALVLAVFARGAFTEAIFFYRDLGLAVRPVLQEARAAPGGGLDLLPYWTHHQSNGRELLANPGNVLLSPLNVLYVALPFADALDAFIVLHVAIAAVGMSLLARWLRAGGAGRFVAGASYGLGGYVVSAMNLLPTLASAAWAPWTVLAALHAARRPGLRATGAFAACLALQGLGGQPEPILLTALAGSVWCLAALAEPRGWRRLVRVAGTWAAGGAWALVLAAPQVLPGALLARGSLRSLGFTLEGVLYNSVRPERLAWLAWPGLGGNPLERLSGGFPGADLTDTGTPYQLTIYAGVTVVALAAVGVALGRGSGLSAGTPSLLRLRWALVASAAAGLLLSMGRFLPGFEETVGFQRLLMPFRFPEKFLFLAFLALPLLAALGVEALRARVAGRLRPAAGAVAAVLVAADLALAHASFAPTLVPDDAWRRPPLAALLHEEASAAGLSPTDWRVHHHHRLRPWPYRLPEERRTEEALARVDRLRLAPATGAAVGIRYAWEVTGDALDTVDYFAVGRDLHVMGDPGDALTLGEASVRHVITPAPHLEDASGGVLKLLTPLGPEQGLPAGSGFVYLDTAFVPRVRLATRVVAAGGGVTSARERYEDAGAWPPPVAVEARVGPLQAGGGGAKTVALESEDGTWRAEIMVRDGAVPGVARIIAEDHHSLTVETVADAAALLVVSDRAAAGWRVEMDGEPGWLLRANGTFRAVPVGAGRHVVRFLYTPPGLRMGVASAAAGLTLLLASWLPLRRLRRPVPRGPRA